MTSAYAAVTCLAVPVKFPSAKAAARCWGVMEAGSRIVCHIRHKSMDWERVDFESRSWVVLMLSHRLCALFR